MVIHTVQPGDSLYRIAQMHDVTLPFLIQQNDLREPYRLTPGQTIVVPQPVQTYTVRRGDTLGDIAARSGTTVLSCGRTTRSSAAPTASGRGRRSSYPMGKSWAVLRSTAMPTRILMCACCAARCPI